MYNIYIYMYIYISTYLYMSICIYTNPSPCEKWSNNNQSKPESHHSCKDTPYDAKPLNVWLSLQKTSNHVPRLVCPSVSAEAPKPYTLSSPSCESVNPSQKSRFRHPRESRRAVYLAVGRAEAPSLGGWAFRRLAMFEVYRC